MSYTEEPNSTPIVMADWQKRCPSCTWGDRGYERTHGCGECGWTGRARMWRAEGKKIGGHWHVNVRCGRPGAGAGLGALVMDEYDWADFKDQVSQYAYWTVTEEKAG